MIDRVSRGPQIFRHMSDAIIPRLRPSFKEVLPNSPVVGNSLIDPIGSDESG